MTGRALRQRLLTGAVSSVAGKFTAVAVWFLLTPFVLSHLGPGGYALWVLMGAVASYGSLLDFGVGSAVVKYVAEHVARGEREAARVVVASALWLSLGLAAATIAIGLALAPTLPGLLGLSPETHWLTTRLIALTALDLAITIAFSPRIAVLRGLQRYDLHNGVSIFGTLVQGAATIAVLEAGGGVLGMIAVNIPVNVAMRLASTFLIRRIAPDLVPSFRGAELATMRRIGSYSYSGFTIDVASRLHNKTAEFVIALFRPLSLITPYALARKLGDAATVAATQCLKVIMPLASELDATDRAHKLQKLYVVASRLALGISVPMVVILSLVGGHVLTLWVGPEYRQYAGLVTVLALASLITTSQWPASEVLQGMARHRIVAATSLAAGVANIGLSVVLLPVLGLMGVALGSLIPTAVTSLCIVMPFMYRTLRVSWQAALRQIWMPPLLPGGAAAATLWLLQHQIDNPGVMTVAGWVVVTLLVYGVGYLSMPAASAERQLFADVLSDGSRTVRVLLNPEEAR